MIYLNDNLESFDFEASLPLLSAQRREQALQFRYELGRKTCAAAYLLIAGHPDIHFNLSHCREAVLCVVSDRPVGCDVESIREFHESLVRYTMNDAEVRQIEQAPHPATEFIRLWTMKEAVLKLSGEGIRDDLKGVLQGKDGFQTVVNQEKNYIYSIVY